MLKVVLKIPFINFINAFNRDYDFIVLIYSFLVILMKGMLKIKTLHKGPPT